MILFLILIFSGLFEQSKQYSAVPDRIFESLKRSNIVKYMKTCKEINIAFIPYEQQVTDYFSFVYVLVSIFIFSFTWF